MGNKIIEYIKSERFPIVISSCALVISLLSLLEAHRGRLISEAVNRPIVTVETNGEAVAGWAKEGSGEFLVKTLFVGSEIKNLGKTPAVITKVDHEIISFGECELGDASEVEFKALDGKEVLPNLSLRAGQAFPILTACEGKSISLIFHRSYLLYYHTFLKPLRAAFL